MRDSSSTERKRRRTRSRSCSPSGAIEPVVYAGWASIDEAERAAGEKLGRPRVKLRTWHDLLEAARRVAAKPAS